MTPRPRPLAAGARAVATACLAGAALAAAPRPTLAAPSGCPAGATRPDARRFLDAARARTARFHDPDVARAEGYRPIGPDMPGMGRHWVHVGLVAGVDSLEPGRPALLTYVERDGRALLAGVAYARPVAAGEQVPALPAPAACWHLHAGAVDEEALAPHQDALGGHAHAAHAAGGATGPAAAGVAMVHVWLWSENPAGLFAAQNWALPWRRAGLAPPDAPGAAAAHALALAADDGAYVDGALARALGDDVRAAATLDALRPVLAAHAARVRARVERLRAEARTPTPDAERALAGEWTALWDALEHAAPRWAAPALRTARQRLAA